MACRSPCISRANQKHLKAPF
uniref:Uncharacterized protein n=1 Tax=Arundo donax TaxID=35708 RepID=A0A0A9CJW6_ARUDO